MAVAIGDLVRVFAELPLLRPAQKLELDRLKQRSSDPNTLVQILVQRGWLTAFQGNCLLQGQATALMFGPYVILESLGEGGLGKVFKARHSTLDRIVALKVLRPEAVADAETVSRFYREIQLAGQLPEHPNLIRAFDGGLIGTTPFLALEYVPGIDLDRYVKVFGPLRIEQACEYIRQAALGLQHAHQHGLVHRDIKPSNLLIADCGSRIADSKGTAASAQVAITDPPSTVNEPSTAFSQSAIRNPQSAIVKIVDLGLARLHDVNQNSGNTLLTNDGDVPLGTVQYQAPEQALDFHRADIRADIYSLGCTFFFLLTGKPPFGGSTVAMLMRHQQAEPPDLKERRPDVPDALIPIIGRMLAKKPEARYQTPGEVAAALSALVRPEPQPRRPLSRALLAGGVCAVLLLLLGIFFLVQHSGHPSDTGKIAVEKAQPPQPPPPAPDSVEATVPEARDYQLVYDLNLARLAREIVYDEDRHAKITQPFDRIAYFIELRRKEGEAAQYLYVSMAAFTTDIKKVGVPAFGTGATFQMNVANMNVYSNVNGIVTGTGIAGGNIEFWPNNYTANNAMNVPNADSRTYDFGDQMTPPVDGYGSMQVHNHDAKQTLFAVNHWRERDKADIGIGNNPNGNPDWTFMGNSGTYRTKRLRVLVRCK